MGPSGPLIHRKEEIELLNVFGLVGSEDDLYEKLINESMQRTRCVMTGVVQSYNSVQNTAEIQPTVRERIVNEDGSVQYVQFPLLINVPVVFPSTSVAKVTFPIYKGCECLILFNDLSYDNFWQKGNVQNPVEVRRHDLSDGIAIPCNLSLPKTKAVDQEGLLISYGSNKIKLTDSTIKLIDKDGEYDLLDIVKQYPNHYHVVMVNGAYVNTSGPYGGG